jgi:CheY-like chemotaxis protein
MPNGFKHLRILVVEDHHDTAHAMANLLAREGHRVRRVHTGAEALAAASEQPFDLLLCDLRLPDITGFEVMRQLKRNHAIKGIAVSGLSSEESMAEAANAGFSRYLAKPVLWETLKRTIAEVMTETPLPREDRTYHPPLPREA